MRYLTPGLDEQASAMPNEQPVETIPSGLDNDPNADADVLDQRTGDNYPKPVAEDSQAKLTADNLADSIAYALDGSGPGPMDEKPNVSGHDVITEGTSGAGPEEERALFGN